MLNQLWEAGISFIHSIEFVQLSLGLDADEAPAGDDKTEIKGTLVKWYFVSDLVTLSYDSGPRGRVRRYK